MTETTGGERSLCCTVVVTTWNRPALLQETLESLMLQSYAAMEVVVVCDGEDAGVRLLADRFSGKYPVRWAFHPVNRGLPTARNTGAKEARGEIILFLDDDVVADTELVNVHMGYHLAAVEGKQIVVSSLTNESRGAPLTTYVDRRLHENRKKLLDSVSNVFSRQGLSSIGDEIEGALWFGLNCSINRDLFIAHGGFDEQLRASDEEMELGIRLYLAGVEFIFEPRRLLTHKNSKRPSSHSRAAWAASGLLDPYRIFGLGQKNAQTRKLVSMFRGCFLDRAWARCVWHLSRPLRTVARWLEGAANRTQSRILFGAWARVCNPAEYWSQVRASGCSLAQLRSVVGPTKCVLAFHSVSEPRTDRESSYYIAPGRFRRFMQMFRTTGYSTATTAEWLRDDVSSKKVLLTFDDGYDDLYDELLPLVVEHGYTPVVFLVAGRIGASNLWDQASGLRARYLLTLDQIREMQRYGVEFGSHTLTHPRLTRVSDAQLRCEVRDSKHHLEDLLGIEITSFAYPFGDVDRHVRSAVAEAGYKLAFTTMPGLNWWNDPLCQRRAEVDNNTTFINFASKLRNGYNFREYLRTFHSGCF